MNVHVKSDLTFVTCFKIKWGGLTKCTIFIFISLLGLECLIPLEEILGY